MREMVMMLWCDTCFREAQAQDPESIPMKVPATRTFSVGLREGDTKPTPKVVDVCDTHAKPFDDMFAQISEVKQLPSEEPKVSYKTLPKVPEKVLHGQRKVLCPVCSDPIKRDQLSGHVWTRHRNDERPEAPTVCPDCRSRYPSPMGCSAHRRSAHGYDALQEALNGVKGYHFDGVAADHLVEA